MWGKYPGHRPKYKNWGKLQEYPQTGNPTYPNTASSHTPYHGNLNKSDVPYMHILWQGASRRVWIENAYLHQSEYVNPVK